MPHCILFVGEEEVARGNGEWINGNEIRFPHFVAAADEVDRMSIDNVNYRVTDYAAHIYSVVYDPIPEH